MNTMKKTYLNGFNPIGQISLILLSGIFSLHFTACSKSADEVAKDLSTEVKTNEPPKQDAQTDGGGTTTTGSGEQTGPTVIPEYPGPSEESPTPKPTPTTEPTDPSVAAPCLTPASSCAQASTLSAKIVTRYYGNYPLHVINSTVTHAVIVVHDSDRDAKSAFEKMVAAAELNGETSQTLIMAPQFISRDDGPMSNEPFWVDRSWETGENAGLKHEQAVTSFGLMDYILDQIAISSVYPNLQSVTVVGLGVGADFVHRYSVAAKIYPRIKNSTVRFVTIGAGNYVYLSGHRPVAGSVDDFAKPSVFDLLTKGCLVLEKNYHHYPYGLYATPKYYKESAKEDDMVADFLKRDVVVMVGDKDTTVDDLNMDQACGSDYQGTHRYNRAMAYYNFLGKYFSGHNHTLKVVSAVGHSYTDILNTADAGEAIFK